MKNLDLLITPKAIEDLENIGDYIAQDNPTRAITFVQELRLRCNDITKRPHIYPLREEFGCNIRLSAQHGRYIILYQCSAHAVTIVRVRHSSREIQNMIDDNEKTKNLL